MAIQPLVHVDFENKSDDQLAAEAAVHLAKNPPLNVMKALIDHLRTGKFPWFTEEDTIGCVPMIDRMEALKERPDLRQVVTTTLAGIKQKRARTYSPSRQAEEIMDTLQKEDVTLAQIETAFDPGTLVVYMDAGRFWKLFRERMPWEDSSPEHKHLIGSLIELLLAHKILTPLMIRSAISGKVWHTHIPMQLRIEIDDALLEREREAPGMPYHAEDILCIVGPKELVEHIPLTEFRGIMDTAEAAMNFASPKEKRALLHSDVNPPPTMIPPAQETAIVQEGGAPEVQDDVVDLTPDEAEALDGEGDDEKGAGELPRLASTIADGAFNAAIERSPSSRRGADMERSSSGGLTASTMTRIIPMLQALAEAGLKLDEGLSLSAGTIETLHSLFAKKEWPMAASVHHLRSAQIVFLRTRNPDGPSEADLKEKKDSDLESKFFLELSKTHRDLVPALRASARQQMRTPPPIKVGNK